MLSKNPVKCFQRGIVEISGNFTVDGSGNVDVTTGQGFSVAHTTTGVYTITFDDIFQVLSRGKYETGQAATWGEGDWDGAPGGSPGSPPTGNGQFDFDDIFASLATGSYETGHYASGGGGSAVPEPSAVPLVIAGVVAAAGNRTTARRLSGFAAQVNRPSGRALCVGIARVEVDVL